MNSDADFDALINALAVDQILLRALLLEVVTRHVAQSTEPEKAKREIMTNLYRYIENYETVGMPEAHQRDLREQARRNLHALTSSLPNLGPNPD